MNDKKDPYKIEDTSILTYVEHKLIGSTVGREDMIRNPHTPQAILDGKRPIDVAAERLKVREIKSVDSGAFDMKFGELPIVKLGNISLKTGRTLDTQLQLVGIYDLMTDKVSRDENDLKKHKLTEEDKRKFMVEDEVGRREKLG